MMPELNRIYQGDCLEIMKGWPDGCIDLIVTDPPYGISADKKKSHSSIRDSDKWPTQSWDECRPRKIVFDEMRRVSKSQVIWGGNYFADFLPPTSGWLSWVKPEADSGFSLADLELCWTSQNKAARAKHLPRRDGNQHPTQKPLACMIWTINYCDEKGPVILDPFCGSGTTLLAAERLGRKWIGIEMEPKYCAIAQARVDAERAQGKLFL